MRKNGTKIHSFRFCVCARLSNAWMNLATAREMQSFSVCFLASFHFATDWEVLSYCYFSSSVFSFRFYSRNQKRFLCAHFRSPQSHSQQCIYKCVCVCTYMCNAFLNIYMLNCFTVKKKIHRLHVVRHTHRVLVVCAFDCILYTYCTTGDSFFWYYRQRVARYSVCAVVVYVCIGGFCSCWFKFARQLHRIRW